VDRRRPDGLCPIEGRDASRHPVFAVDRDSEGGAAERGVVGHHRRELQFVEPPAGHREADQAASVRGHEVDGLERDSSKFRGET
jgi:hypothetical protein